MMTQDKQEIHTPVTVFLSYAHEDEPLRVQLEKHLRLLQRQGLLSTWHDRQIVPGTKWAQEIDAHLAAAQLVLLLISPDFLDSDYCYGIEMQRALERHQNGEAQVIPILLRPVDWEGAPFTHLQCLPREARAVTEWDNRDAAFRDIARGIRAVLEQLPLTSTQVSSVPAASGVPAPTSTRAPAALADRNRQRMLKRVRATWIAGVLEQSLHNAALMVLELEEKADVLDNPWRLLIQEVDRPTQPLPTGTRITQIYDTTEGGLLILGEPGAGKTTLLLELARDLLDRAQINEDAPIPVVFNLSSWAKKRSALSDWLVEELSTRYEVPRQLGQSWVNVDRLLLLLDGLDEVASAARKECIEVINQYRQTHPDIQIVVCSRRTEYLEEPTQLRLHTAVVVQPLTQEQIDTYLESVGKQAEVLREVLRQDADLRELATTPLMLTILLFAYRGTSPDKISELTSLEAKREQIFASYMQHMLKRRGALRRYKPEQITHWLTYLAKQMKRQNQTLFSLEQMQPPWLSNEPLHHLYISGGIRVPGILLGVLTSLIFLCFFFIPTIHTPPIFLTSCIFIGGFLGSLLSRTPRRGESIAPTKNNFKRRLLARGAIALSTSIVMAIVAKLSLEPFFNNSNASGQNVFIGTVGLAGLLLTFFVEPGVSSLTANKEERDLSRKSAFRNLLQSSPVRNGGLVGGIASLVLMLGTGLSYVLSDGGLWNKANVLMTLAAGLLIGLPIGLLSALLSFLLADRSGKIEVVERLTWTWQALWRSLKNREHLKNALLFGLLIMIGVGLYILLLTWSSPYTPDRNAFETGLMSVLSIGFSGTAIYWALFGLFRGVSGGRLDERERIVPNQGIHRSAWNGLLFGFIGGSICLFVFLLSIVFALVFYFASSSLFTWMNNTGAGTTPSGSSTSGLGGIDVSIALLALPAILVFAFASCMIIGLQTGWLACLRHYLLRCLLWFNGSIPWNYTHFLDYAVERLLLRKAGGGYLFMHRLLLDYLASLDTSILEGETSAIQANKNAPPDLSQTLIVHQGRSAGCKTGAILFVEGMLLLALTCGVSLFGEAQQRAYNANATTQVKANATAVAQATVQVKANATAEAAANASPVAYPPKSMSPVLDDPLQDNSKGYRWEIDDPKNGNCKFINRTYDINTQSLEQCFARSTDFTNFVYEVQMKIVKGDGGGIAFRADPTEYPYYYFVINPDGSYHIYDSSSTFPLAQGSSPAINRGLNQTNLVAAVVHGTIIELYVNHERVAVIGSITYTHGEIGMVVTGSDHQTEVIFQHAKVWRL